MNALRQIAESGVEFAVARASSAHGPGRTGATVHRVVHYQDVEGTRKILVEAA